MRRRKVGDIGLRLLLENQRELRHKKAAEQRAELDKLDEQIKKTIHRLRDSGASITVICEAYGTKDRHTIIEILREDIE